MRIIKEPSTNPWWNGKRGTCKHCGIEIELEAEDARHLQGGEQYALYAECPNCERMIQITGLGGTTKDASTQAR